MKPKYKALLLNFIFFALLFFIFRFLIDYLLDNSRFINSVIAAILASILAPKFGSVKTEQGEKILVKWIFKKGVKEI